MTPASADDLARYARQIAFAPLGAEGQRRLLRSRAVLIGCGALGSAAAQTLVRAGVGQVRIVDRDFVELDNLQRQTLFDEDDVAAAAPKAVAAADKLRRINSATTIEPLVADVHAGNIAELCAGADVLLDGSDNLETRYLLNDYAVQVGAPWVYGACVAAEGRVLPIVPGRTPCLRCIFPDPPPPGALPTCESAGVLAAAAAIVANLQAVEALKLLSGADDALLRRMIAFDLWRGRIRYLNVGGPVSDCPCCGLRRFEFLSADRAARAAVLCGRNAVQITPADDADLDLAGLAQTLGARVVRANAHLVRFAAESCEVTVFRDGRAIVQGVDDLAAARAVYARYLGG